jgi:hypothetical protein
MTAAPRFSEAPIDGVIDFDPPAEVGVCGVCDAE